MGFLSLHTSYWHPTIEPRCSRRPRRGVRAGGLVQCRVQERGRGGWSSPAGTTRSGTSQPARWAAVVESPTTPPSSRVLEAPSVGIPMWGCISVQFHVIGPATRVKLVRRDRFLGADHSVAGQRDPARDPAMALFDRGLGQLRNLGASADAVPTQGLLEVCNLVLEAVGAWVGEGVWGVGGLGGTFPASIPSCMQTSASRAPTASQTSWARVSCW